MSATTQSGLIPPRRPAEGNSSDAVSEGSNEQPSDFGTDSTAGTESNVRLRFGRASISGSSFEWLLKRNCSMAPRQLAAVYTSLCVVSLTIAAYCWAQGATLVMPFAWAELVGVGTALFVYARHATDFEHIDLRRGRLVVEHINGIHIERVEFESVWVRVEPADGDRSLIELSGQGKQISIGRFVRPELRRQLAEELRAALRGWPAPKMNLTT